MSKTRQEVNAIVFPEGMFLWMMEAATCIRSGDRALYGGGFIRLVQRRYWPAYPLHSSF